MKGFHLLVKLSLQPVSAYLILFSGGVFTCWCFGWRGVFVLPLARRPNPLHQLLFQPTGGSAIEAAFPHFTTTTSLADVTSHAVM